MTKFCPKCQVETERNTKGDCKPCAIVRVKKWVENNREKHNKKCAEWAKNHREKGNARSAKYRQKTRIRKQTTKAYRKHKALSSI